MTPRGALVVLEGAEGTGKTTQLARLAAALEQSGVPVVLLREPGGTSLGEGIRQLLLDPAQSPAAGAEALLFLASRAQLVTELIRPAMARGEVVLLDRFFLSTYAYQVSGRGLDGEQVRAANQLAVGGLVPDVTVVLQLSAATGLRRAAARGARDRMELADADFHARVAEAFERFATVGWQHAHPECGVIAAVDASAGREQVFRSIAQRIVEHVPRLASALSVAAGV